MIIRISEYQGIFIVGFVLAGTTGMEVISTVSSVLLGVLCERFWLVEGYGRIVHSRSVGDTACSSNVARLALFCAEGLGRMDESGVGKVRVGACDEL